MPAPRMAGLILSGFYNTLVFLNKLSATMPIKIPIKSKPISAIDAVRPGIKD